MNVDRQTAVSPWPHRLAVVLACATFPLVWVGGLVTTTDAGMAVPDWPGTYGYNLFLYPWQTWLAGPWDLLVEHGHRLLGATVGLLAIALAAALWRGEPRRWVRWLGALALGLVIVQGVLGGMRVLLDERTLALVHGCVGPLFFALAVAMAVVTSRTWREAAPPATAGKSKSLLLPLAMIAPLLFYAQLVLGAVLRHVPVAAEPGVFLVVVKFHLLLAGLLVAHVGGLLWSALRLDVPQRTLRNATLLLAALLAAQLALGVGTWLVKYSVPNWASTWLALEGFTVRAGGLLQTHVVTAHVALGSLLLVTSVVLALRAGRLLGARSSSVSLSHLALEGAR